MNLPEYLTANQIADMLQMHPNTVIRAAREGRLPKPAYPCRRPRRRKDELLAFLDKPSGAGTTRAPGASDNCN